MLNKPIKQLLVNATGVTSDSRSVQKGDVFVAYPGEHSDGRDYIAQAINAGAAGVIFEDDHGFVWSDEWSVSHVAVKELKKKVSEIASYFYGEPSKSCTVIGVTGTNGKTTVSQWVAQCLAYLGNKSVVIGTIGNGFVDDIEATVNTTPDAILLQALLSEYVARGAKSVAMEVSSHGLDQGRVAAVAFDIAVLTNLSRDHLDYHKTMEAYGNAKRQLFNVPGLRCAIINADDAFGQTVAGELIEGGQSVLTYSLAGSESDKTKYGHKNHLQGHDLVLAEQGLTMQVSTPKGDVAINANVLGEFNAYNILAVLGVLINLDVELVKAVEAIAHIKPVEGRMQQFGGEVYPLVVIDYAHTPDALEKVLVSLRKQIQTHGELVCVFGCGGDRDEGKRPLMGQIATANADVVVVTSDNPRGEDAQVIANAVVADLKVKTHIELDREVAIKNVIASASAGDIVLIAGKGHEAYQEISGVKYAFSDAAVVQQALADYKAAA